MAVGMLYSHAGKCCQNNMGVLGNGNPVNSFQVELVEELSRLTNIRETMRGKKGTDCIQMTEMRGLDFKFQIW